MMGRKLIMQILFLLLVMLSLPSIGAMNSVSVGAKNFTENYLLGELISQTIEDQLGRNVKREFGLQGTGIIYEALINGKIDMYVEYTGTLSEAVLKNPNLKTLDEIKKAMSERGLVVSDPLGFNNTYALAVSRSSSEKYGLKTISDLARQGDNLRYGFTYEFMSRSDGFSQLKAAYKLNIDNQKVRIMDHALLYTAFETQQVDVMEVYSTDAKVAKLDLVLLKDDQNFFPRYEAVLVSTNKFVIKNSELWTTIVEQLAGSITEADIRKMNAQMDLEKKSATRIVSGFLKKETHSFADSDALMSRLFRRTKEHVSLVGYSLLVALLMGIPLAIVASYVPLFAQMILMLASLVQTIPSLALLCFLIPVFGIGQLPALVALILYGLFPIVLNTFTALENLDKNYNDSARALGLSAWQRLIYIELPLVSPQILAGVKTSAIIGIGTATLAAFIGAGGYGAPIVIGLAMNDIPTILWGAVPAALMALCTHFIFEILTKLIVPKGLKK